MKTKSKWKPDLQERGRFKVTSGEIVLCDPCYFGEESRTALGGEWVGLTAEGYSLIFSNPRNPGKQKRTAILVACHAGFLRNAKTFLRGATPKGLTRVQEILDVDSGQMCVFDGMIFGEQHYEECCQKSNPSGFVGDFGFVTDTGDGDGSYKATIWKNQDNQVVAVKVVFYRASEVF